MVLRVRHYTHVAACGLMCSHDKVQLDQPKETGCPGFSECLHYFIFFLVGTHKDKTQA